MKRLAVIIFLLLLAAAFIAGYWLSHKELREAEDHLKSVSLRLTDAESRIRLCRLQSDLVALVYKTADKNYGDALPLSTRFFDQVLAEAGRADNQKWKPSLEAILQKRDVVTAALAKGDSSAYDLLVPLQKALHDLADAGGR